MSISFNIEAWSAIAPGLDSEAEWLAWSSGKKSIDGSEINANLSHIPPMQRRRFNALGKSAMAAIGDLQTEQQQIPCVFASRHGDTALTLSLLESMGRNENISPTGFSLAVHNAISGLYTIVTKDTSAVTAIAAMQGLILNTLCEAIGQLQDSDKVLCVIYDVPLPPVYLNFCASDAFPFALAFIISTEHKQQYVLRQNPTSVPDAIADSVNTELQRFMAFLLKDTAEFQQDLNGVCWTLSRTQDVS